MKKPLELTLVVYAGQTFDDRLQLTDSDGVPVDLSGYEARMQARTDISDAVPAIDWSTDDGTIVIGGAEGTISFNVTAAQTFALATGAYDSLQYVYDLRMYNDASPSYAERVIQGVIVINPAVTRVV